jgi:hypothetical protein
MTTPIADAALLAAGADPPGAISPRELELGPAWLDLRGDQLLVASNRARLVGSSLAACLSLQSDSQLFVTAKPERPESIAKRIASSFSASVSGALIAVLRGEDVSSRLEELMAAGVELRDKQPPYKSLLVETRALVSAVVAAPPSVLREAIEAGAKVVVSSTADRGTIEAAIGGATEAGGPRQVTLQFHNRYEVTAALHDPRQIDDLKSLIGEHLPKGVSCELRDSQGVKLLDLSASEPKAFTLACNRCDLLLDGLPTRLTSMSRRVYDEWTIDVPAEYFEFGYDLRTAEEWLSG